MIFRETKLNGAYIIEPERLEDERGFFARAWCQREFEIKGFNPDVVQCNISFNKKRGTLRGLHYQISPHAEAKVVRCTCGAIFDVIVDLRPDSCTYMAYISVELSAGNRLALYVPEGFAHGFQTLEDDSEVFYQMSEYYHPESARGLRWDDPALGISWPVSPGQLISDRDKGWPLLKQYDERK
jgi:dTDP-4-dehydrorhamnose 3,5-epimerase